MNFSFEVETSVSPIPWREELLCHCSASSNYYELIYGWVSKERKVELCSGVSEDGKPLVYLVFLHGKIEVGQIFSTVDDILVEFPDVEAVQIALVPDSKRMDLDQPCYDPEVLDRIKARFNPQWDENLYSNVVSREAAIKIALCYATSCVGEAEICYPDELGAEFRFCEFDSIPAQYEDLLVLYVHFRDEKTGSGWGDSFDIVKNMSAVPVSV